ncbi:MAG: hypothetical protein K0S65_6353, partial [Labilithrix sp.]|nr:hypothetical protein [Labilithrix sp.]
MNKSSSSTHLITLAFARAERIFTAVELDDVALHAHARQLRDWYNATENASM